MQERVVLAGRVALLLSAAVFWRCDATLNRASGRAQEPAPEPRVAIYREVDERRLQAYIFEPATKAPRDGRSAVLLFHGGGWSVGEPEWTFYAARSFANAGMVAIPIQYRLSQDQVTPIEALADVCAAFRWARVNAADLGIDPTRVAGYGVSAGGHLVASAATVGCPDEASAARSSPDALLLLSPALDLSGDRWFEQKLLGRAAAVAYSPADHVRSGTPPTNIVIGEKDTLTPVTGAKRYCDRLVELRGDCQLQVFPGLGHLLTRNLANQESDFDPDPKAREKGFQSHLRLLEKLRFIEPRRN